MEVLLRPCRDPVGREHPAAPPAVLLAASPGSSARGVHELIGTALEGVVDGQRLGIGKRQVLHHDHARDAALGIDPEERVVDAAPAQAARGALAGNLIGGDEETQSPLVPAVRDEGEVGAARQRGLERLIQKLMERGAGS
jgi:hypothetical protein